MIMKNYFKKKIIKIFLFNLPIFAGIFDVYLLPFRLIELIVLYEKKRGN